jgi:phosphoglycerate dehydrogenase-like enzyme
LTLPNVVVTPHIAWLTPETLSRSLDIAIENCRRLKLGEALLHEVSWDPDISSGARASASSISGN